MSSLSFSDVRAAAHRLRDAAIRTPVLTSRTLDAMTGATVLLKAEVFQRTGSFKFRGAYNRIASLPLEKRGVLAISSGNHAQAVALAARLRGARATIVMPADAPAIKRAATAGYGGEVITYDRQTEDREALGRRIAADRRLTLVHPFDDPLVIAGQGTAALELLEDVGEIDLLVAPVSGGGLIAGCATAVKTLCPKARVVGVEPEGADDYRRSLRAGQRVAIDAPSTLADALRVTTPGELTFALNRVLVDEITTVSDAELVEAMRFGFERLKLVIEPGGAAGLAALLAGKLKAGPDRRVAVILSGGNVDPGQFGALLSIPPPRSA